MSAKNAKAVIHYVVLCFMYGTVRFDYLRLCKVRSSHNHNDHKVVLLSEMSARNAEDCDTLC